MQIIETFGHYVENLTKHKTRLSPLAAKNRLGSTESEVPLYAGQETDALQTGILQI